MKTYKTSKTILMTCIVVFALTLAVMVALLMWVPNQTWAYVVLVLLAMLLGLLYQNIVFEMRVDDKCLKIKRILHTDTIIFKDVAICIEDQVNKKATVLYCFMRSGEYVRGVVQKIPFDEVVKKTGGHRKSKDLTLRLNKAKRVQVAFVNDPTDLRDEITRKIKATHKIRN